MQTAVLIFLGVLLAGNTGDTAKSGMSRVEGGRYVPMYGAGKSETVAVGSFEMDKLPVTNADFLAFVKQYPRWKKSDVPRLFADAGYLKNWTEDLSYPSSLAGGKLYFGSMKVKHCRIHNRPAYNSEVHSTRDMGVDELNYAYTDYQITDTILLVGTNPVECQTNLFLNHMVKGMQNGAKVIVVDPRRTVTVDACEQVAGPENVTGNVAAQAGIPFIRNRPQLARK